MAAQYSPEQVAAMSPKELAMASAQTLFGRESAAQDLGIKIIAMDEGSCELSMTVQGRMLNGHASCHGGFIFALADTAFAYACNSRNHNTVAQGCSIEYLAPGFEGDVLKAVAEERSQAGRTGVYDITIYNQNNQQLALFRGKSYKIRGAVIPGTEPA
ncbi:MAG: hydroxyphenylacetyl-CoA thioesterase PaaI [Cellvibrionaceae bacterium]|nr:hydroxyphenylacetyl-CoA thioesterase PaaI [Cellvibrionaceae bacterium]